MVGAVLDTCILIDFLKGVPSAVAEVNSHQDRYISVITWMEVLVGEDSPEVRAFLSHFDVIPVSPEIAERAIRIRRDLRMKLPDAIIYATAQIHLHIFVTRNTKDFRKTDPDVRMPYTI